VNRYHIFRADGTASNHAGYFWKDAATYALAHDANASDSVRNDLALFRVGQYAFTAGPNVYTIWRGLLQFDTSSLAGKTILSADLLFKDDTTYGWSVNFALYLVVPAAPFSFPYVNAYYYDVLLGATTSAGYIQAGPSYIRGGWNVINLNAAGIANINQTGITGFGLRTSKDINNQTPGSAPNMVYSEYIDIIGAEALSTSRRGPKLIVKVA